MSSHLLVILIAVTTAQQRGEIRRPPDVPPGGTIVTVATFFGGERKLRYITVTMPEAKRSVEEDGEDEKPRPRVRINLQTAVLDPDNFDRWLFDDDRSARDRQEQLEKILVERVRSDGVGRTLTKAQQASLRLAGRGDIKRFFDHVEDERSRFEKERRSWRAGFKALHRLDPLAEVYKEGPFGAGSLYSKMLRKIDMEPASGR